MEQNPGEILALVELKVYYEGQQTFSMKQQRVNVSHGMSHALSTMT